MSTPLLVTKRPDGAVDTLHDDGLKTRAADGVVVVVRGVGSITTGDVYGYVAQWIYERLSDPEITTILESEYVEELADRIAAGLTLFDAGIDLLRELSIDIEAVVEREPVRSWPPTEFLEEEE